jgi:hypothetical protein
VKFVNVSRIAKSSSTRLPEILALAVDGMVNHLPTRSPLSSTVNDYIESPSGDYVTVDPQTLWGITAVEELYYVRDKYHPFTSPDADLMNQDGLNLKKCHLIC